MKYKVKGASFLYGKTTGRTCQIDSMASEAAQLDKMTGSNK